MAGWGRVVWVGQRGCQVLLGVDWCGRQVRRWVLLVAVIVVLLWVLLVFSGCCGLPRVVRLVRVILRRGPAGCGSVRWLPGSVGAVEQVSKEGSVALEVGYFVHRRHGVGVGGRCCPC